MMTWTCRVFVSLLIVASALEPGLAEQRSTPHWIWPARVEDGPAQAWLRVRFELPADAEVDHADLLAAADDQATFYLNGQQAGVVRGYERMAHHEVRKLLRKGSNVLAVAARSEQGRAGVLASLHVVLKGGGEVWLASNDAWRATREENADWLTADFNDQRWPAAVSLGPIGVRPWGTPTFDVDSYNQWKQALGAETAVDPRAIQVPTGFAIELVRSAGKDEGSWISLAFDERGRLYIGREDRGILRLTLPEMPQHRLAGDEAISVTRLETIDETLLEPRGLLLVGRDLYVNANNSKGLYRLRDADGDDRFEDIQLLRTMPGGVGHGRNDLTLGPDGKLYLMLGNDVRLPDDYQPGRSPFQHYDRDRLLPCEWNKYLFNVGVKPPAGHVVRTDLEGKTWEVIAGGFRNAYGIAFNEDGELFTYDADMEGDAGAPWYRPTRINHIVSGADYGWRQGVDKWRAWYPDSVPSTLDIGLGSPTAVKFVPKQFSGKMAGSLLALDWAYGRVLAIRLTPEGASYRATQETFVSGRPLNVCDLEFGPEGALYFVTGGRGTQSGLYRVVELPEGKTSAMKAADEAATAARQLRRQLEAFHGGEHPQAIATAWPHLASADPWIRHAARVALEFQPVGRWREKALAEQHPTAAGEALLALARVGEADTQAALLERLAELSGKPLALPERILLLRACQLSLLRQGKPDDARCQELRRWLEPLYPADALEVNDLLAELLVFLQSPVVVERTLPLVDAAPTTEEKMHYLWCLRLAEGPWTPAQRRAYFTWLQRAEKFPAAHYQLRFVSYIRQDAVARLTDEERQLLQPLLEPAPASTEAEETGPPRPFRQAWTLDDFARELERPEKPEIAKGRELFRVAQCHACHRMQGEGALVGPDLTGVGKRFSRRDLLISILEPSKVIDDKYRQQQVVTTRGVSFVGQAIGEDETTISLITDPTQPLKVTRILREEIEETRPSPLSPMPAGLVNILSQEEIGYLLDYLAGDGLPPDEAEKLHQ